MIVPGAAWPEDEWFRISGTVVSVRRVRSHKGAILLRGTLAVDDERLAFIVFPKSTPALEHVLSPERSVSVRGRIEYRGSSPTLLVQDAENRSPEGR